jgi:hypothetical protein
MLWRNLALVAPLDSMDAQQKRITVGKLYMVRDGYFDDVDAAIGHTQAQ